MTIPSSGGTAYPPLSYPTQKRANTENADTKEPLVSTPPREPVLPELPAQDATTIPKGADQQAQVNRLQVKPKKENVPPAGNAGASTEEVTTPPKAKPGNAGNGTDDPLDVYVVDDFTPEAEDNFNHGEAVSNIIGQGGLKSDLADDVKIHKINVDSGNDEERVQNINDALDQVLEKARKDPKSVDAVNISQQAPFMDGDVAKVQEKIKELQKLGVPVVVAAGNNGPNTPNTLAGDGAIVVESAEKNGQARTDSGQGTTRVFTQVGDSDESQTTSFATPQLAPWVAELKAQGKTPEEIQGILDKEATKNGGFFSGGAQFENVFTNNTTVPYGEKGDTQDETLTQPRQPNAPSGQNIPAERNPLIQNPLLPTEQRIPLQPVFESGEIVPGEVVEGQEVSQPRKPLVESGYQLPSQPPSQGSDFMTTFQNFLIQGQELFKYFGFQI